MGIDLATGEIIQDIENIEIENLEDNEDMKKGKGKKIHGFSCRTNKEIDEKLEQWQNELGATKTDIFKLMVDSFKMEKLKGSTPGRAKEIDTFAATINSLITMYSGSLEINMNSEAAIKENFTKELETKNAIILNLEQNKKELLDKANELKTLEENIKELNKTIVALTEEVTNLKETNNTLTKYNKKVDAEVEEFKKYKDINIKLEKDKKELTTIIDTKTKDFNDKDLENKNLKKEIVLLDKTIVQNKDLYKQLKDNIELERDTLKQDIKDLKAEHKNNIKELKQEHIQAISTLKTEHIEAINTLKLESEKGLDKARETLRQERATYNTNLKKVIDENDILKAELNKLKLNSK